MFRPILMLLKLPATSRSTAIPICKTRRRRRHRAHRSPAEPQASNQAVDAEGPNRIDIKPLKRTYMQVTIDDDPAKLAFERWVSPSDGTVQFRGHHFSVRVLDREAVEIRKNGKIVSNGDTDLRITAQ